MTSKPISTISYNTLPFLMDKLKTWYDGHIIQAYQYICHKGEDGDKDHIHLRLEPNSRIDQMSLAEDLREYLPGFDKPLSVRPFRPSKEEDWYLYAVHDPEYMKLKYAADKYEKLPYKYTDIQVSDMYDLDSAFLRAKAALKHGAINLAKRISEGDTSLKLILEGENVHTVNAIKRAVADSDYTRLQNDFNKLSYRYSQLMSLCNDRKIYVDFDTNDVLYLKHDR